MLESHPGRAAILLHEAVGFMLRNLEILQEKQTILKTP